MKRNPFRKQKTVNPHPSKSLGDSFEDATGDALRNEGAESELLRAVSGAHVVVTGVTGFLGKVWAAMLLDMGPAPAKMTVVLRPKGSQSARQRMDDIIERSPAFRGVREALGERLFEVLDARVDVREGDATKPNLGLEPEAASALAASVDAVVHFAGLTDFEPDPSLATRTNIDGALHVADFAATTRGKKLLHVSTAFVAGSADGIVDEKVELRRTPNGHVIDPADELQNLKRLLSETRGRNRRVTAASERARDLGWPNIYTYTKGLAEQLLSLRTDIETTIVRPSIVESSVSYPFPGWNEGVNTSAPMVWLLSTSFRFFPSKPENTFDVIPVDYVAKGTTAVLGALLRGEAKPVYHLASSDRHPLSFERAIELTALAARRMHARQLAKDPDDSNLNAWDTNGWLLRLKAQLDAVPAPVTPRAMPQSHTLRQLAGQGGKLIKRMSSHPLLDQARWSAPGMGLVHQHLVGARLLPLLAKLQSTLRSTERRLGKVETLLRVYRPFIFENNYRFRTSNIESLFASLDAESYAQLGYNITDVAWREYWLDTHIPGLEMWSLPILDGQRPPVDVPGVTRAGLKSVVHNLPPKKSAIAHKRQGGHEAAPQKSARLA